MQSGNAHRSAELISDATLKVYAGAPHAKPTTHANQINADLLEFAKRQASVATLAAA